MQYKLCSEKRNGAAPSGATESELQTELNGLAFLPDRPDRLEVQKASWTEDSWTVPNKAMAASVPGSEYWLP